jgi:tyrosyl-tRNA synthetase
VSLESIGTATTPLPDACRSLFPPPSLASFWQAALLEKSRVRAERAKQEALAAVQRERAEKRNLAEKKKEEEQALILNKGGKKGSRPKLKFGLSGAGRL